MRWMRGMQGTHSRFMQVVIAGAGAAGVLVLANLVRKAKTPFSITLIEKTSALGRGIAYGTPSSEHLLNVKSGNMGVFPEDRESFAHWLGTDGEEYEPRQAYGEYLAQVLEGARALAERKGIGVEVMEGEAAALENDALRLSDGRRLPLSHLVLATGNGVPERPRFITDAAWNDPRCVQNPWDVEAILRAMPKPDGTVAVIGSGLTAVDVLLTLREHGFSGAIFCLSRRGKLPSAHRNAGAYAPDWSALTQPQELTALSCLRVIHAEARKAIKAGVDWRAAMDSLRPLAVTIWRKLPAPERRKVFTRLFTYWNVHRHRVAPQIAAVVESMRENGQLMLRAARIRRIEAGPRFSIETENRICIADCVINATGPGYDIRRSANPLLLNLLEKGYILPHATGWGIAVEGVKAEGASPLPVYALGALTVGEYFECTAVPEIRESAAAVAEAILEIR